MRWQHLSTFLLPALCLSLVLPSQAQHTYRAIVQDAHEGTPLIGVNVVLEGTTIGAATGADGHVAISGIPSGNQTFTFSFVGHESVRRTHVFPLADPSDIDLITLEDAHDEMEAVAITATRTSRTISDSPTRVETIAGEEIEEKISMEPSNISMLLNESPGITVQQTSAVSGGASLRIQGLDGRYTQMLKDGFPLYGGFSGGLSLLQIPPLDLAQVEVIKGPSSTLYGGDAIAGLVNLVSKKPTPRSQTSLLANVTSAGGLDLGGFYSGRDEKMGLTILASGNIQQAYDPDDDAFSNLPQTSRFSLHPTVFYYPNEQTTVSVGLAGTSEDRKGGDMDVIERGFRPDRSFLERNESTRLTSQVRLDHAVDNRMHVTVKQSLSFFDRAIDVPGYRFDGRQIASYTETSMLLNRYEHDIVFGLDLRTDNFEEDTDNKVEARDYSYTSVGVFVQDTWDVSRRLAMETGVRIDYHNTFDFFVLPKASILYRINNSLSTRIGGGLGYKAPTVFLEPSEERAFRGVVPLGKDVRAETSQGGSLDVNYQTLLFGQLGVSLNQAFYFTNLKHPLVPIVDPEVDQLRYENANGAIETRAWETNAKLSWRDLKLFLGYVYLDAQTADDDQRDPIPLTPKHKTYSVLVYEQHGKGRIGLEAYYTGPQELIGGSSTSGYWIAGIMGERQFGPARLFLNFENILDAKQSNYSPVVMGHRTTPDFAEIWAPMDGFIVNGGVKYTL